MRPYLAVIKDSFREAFASRVLWVLLILILLFLLSIAPLGYHAVPQVRLLPGDIPPPQDLAFVLKLVNARGNDETPAGHIAGLLSSNLNDRMREIAELGNSDETLTEEEAIEIVRGYSNTVRNLLGELNALLYSRRFYDQAAWARVPLDSEGQELVDRGLDNLSDEETSRLNRLALDAAFPDEIRPASEGAVSIVYLHRTLLEEVPLAESQLQDLVSGALTRVVNFLVGVFGIIVALVVTSFIVPRMLDTGAVDLLLSKPVSRPLLLLSKFVGGCAFILLCTAFLNTGVWLIIGVRFGIWNSGLLWAIFVFVFVFAIYYSVSTAAAMIWRSAIVSIILAVLFWAACFSVGFARNRIEEWFLDAERTAAIMPTDDTLLVTNWAGAWFQWNDEDSRFTETVRDEAGPAFMTGYPFLGPVYDGRNDRMVAVRIPLRAGFMPSALLVALGEDDYVPLLGELLPVDTQSLMLDADGSIIVAGLDGIYRFNGNPTVNLQTMQRLGIDRESPEEESPLVRLDDGSRSWRSPFDAAIDPQLDRLAVVSGDQIFVLEESGEATFAVVESTERRSSAGAVVGISGDVVLVAREDGVIRILNRATLNEKEHFQPFGQKEPRDVVASPDGRWLAVQFHNRKVWLYDARAAAAADASLRAQGDISAIAFAPDNTLYAGDGFGRVIQYRPSGGFSEVRRWDPEPGLLERIYRWGVLPLYTVFPKPGEMDNLIIWLMTRQQTPAEDEREEDDLGFDPAREIQQSVPNIWQPLWSNLAFLAVMLALTSFYFTRKEF